MLAPRLDPDEIVYLSEMLANKPDGTKMVEWGSGGSTLMFLPYFETGELISIEHNKEWFDKVITQIHTDTVAQTLTPESVRNLTYIYAEPLVPINFYGYGVPYEENPCFAQRYINPSSPTFNVWDADIFFVDGICRGAILATIYSNITKHQPTILIHDYFGQEKREPWYEWASMLYESVEQVGTTLARLHVKA